MTSELFAKYDVHVPRYTSYPMVPAWHAAPTAAQWTASLQRALSDPAATLSLSAASEAAIGELVGWVDATTR